MSPEHTTHTPTADAAASAYPIRLAGAHDAGAVVSVEVAAALRFRETAHAELVHTRPGSIEDYRLAAVERRLWVALSRSVPIGFALVEVDDVDVHLEEIDVAPEHGGRGVGARLLARVCDWARARGAPAVTLTSFDDVAWNRPFYERRGFRVLEQAELSIALSRRMQEEAAVGLNVSRVAMRRLLSPGGEAL
jgi:GNAT superfamily N-acetyltransferase